MGKTLVAYFSAEGTTAKVAEKLAALGGFDLFRIREKVPYTKEDLDWRNRKSRTSVEMADPSSRPEIAETADLSGYDRIFLGFPIWWYVAPTVVNTFLESACTDGKRIVLFATSGGSGFGKTAEALRKSAPGAEIADGKMMNGATEKDYTELMEM